MKKRLMAVLFMAVVAIGYTGMNASQAIAHEEKAGAELCPKCGSALDIGTKPVVSMWQGKKHTCAMCGKEFTVAAENIHECKTCGKAVLECPSCKGLSLAE